MQATNRHGQCSLPIELESTKRPLLLTTRLRLPHSNHNVGGKSIRILFDRCLLNPSPTIPSIDWVVGPAPVYELIANELWHRKRVRFKLSLHGGTPKTPAASPSPILRLPQELVEQIISHFIHDIHSSRVLDDLLLVVRLYRPPSPPYPHNSRFAPPPRVPLAQTTQKIV